MQWLKTQAERVGSRTVMGTTARKDNTRLINRETGEGNRLHVFMNPGLTTLVSPNLNV